MAVEFSSGTFGLCLFSWQTKYEVHCCRHNTTREVALYHRHTTRASFISPFVPLFPAQQNLELVSQSRRTLESSQLSPLVPSPYWSAIYPILCSVDEGRSTGKEKSVNHPFKEYKL